MKYPHKKYPLKKLALFLRSNVVSVCNALRSRWDSECWDSRPGGSSEVLVSVSESGFPFYLCGQLSFGHIFCDDISGHP